MTEQLKYGKPERFVSNAALAHYRSQHPRCEVIGCINFSAPEPHHLRPRARGRDDSPDNLIAFCPECHGRWHWLGGKEWYRRYHDRLLVGTRMKVALALRLPEVE